MKNVLSFRPSPPLRGKFHNLFFHLPPSLFLILLKDKIPPRYTETHSVVLSDYLYHCILSSNNEVVLATSSHPGLSCLSLSQPDHHHHLLPRPLLERRISQQDGEGGGQQPSDLRHLYWHLPGSGWLSPWKRRSGNFHFNVRLLVGVFFSQIAHALENLCEGFPWLFEVKSLSVQFSLRIFEHFDRFAGGW